MNASFLSKPDVYVELIVDAGTRKERTTVKKKCSAPIWDETFTVQVHESSQIEFRVLAKSKLFDDSLLGHKTLRISHAIKKDSDKGRCKSRGFL